MKIKEKIITSLICLIAISLFAVINGYQNVSEADKIYNVYLDGKAIGAITDKDALYSLIDEKQQNIKDKYNVNNVYPPSGLQIVENYAYDIKPDEINNIYKKIEDSQDFTIKGYEIKVGKGSDHDEFSLYVLDKNIFREAVKDFILAFIDEEDYQKYLNGEQEELDDIGKTYNSMTILENIVIREKYISINDKIYQNSEELAQQLLFGFNYKTKTYTVKEGDTIESISDDNSLNTQEFLVANPEYSSKDSLLTIGDTVNITLINPQISFAYNAYEMKQVEYDYETKIERDESKPSSYSEITQNGVKGLSLVTSHYTVVNGEQNTDEIIDNEKVLIAKVDQITTKGRKSVVWGWNNYTDTGTGWRWPTSNPYAITSEFTWRWGKQHNGIDISGPGEGSKIYAANDGVVSYASSGCPDNGSYPNNCGGGYGNYVIIDHGNNIYTLYGHMLQNIRVRTGQTVSRGDVIGYMGNSGQSKGVHLHFGLSQGNPNSGGTWQNPRELFK